MKHSEARSGFIKNFLAFNYLHYDTKLQFSASVEIFSPSRRWILEKLSATVISPHWTARRSPPWFFRIKSFNEIFQVCRAQENLAGSSHLKFSPLAHHSSPHCFSIKLFIADTCFGTRHQRCIKNPPAYLPACLPLMSLIHNMLRCVFYLWISAQVFFASFKNKLYIPACVSLSLSLLTLLLKISQGSP